MRSGCCAPTRCARRPTGSSCACTPPAATGPARSGLPPVRSTLERELGVEPSAATRAAYEALLPASPSRRPRRRRRVAPPLVGRAGERAQLPRRGGPPRRARPGSCWCTGEAGRREDPPRRGVPRVVRAPGRGPRPRRVATRRRARWPTARWSAWLRSGALRPRLRGSTGRRLPSSPACCPSCSSSCPTSEARRRCPRPTSGCGCSTPSRRRARRRAGRCCSSLDDLQHVDRETCKLLHYLLRVAARRPPARRGHGPSRGDRPRPSRARAAGRAARARPAHRDRAGPPRPGARPRRSPSGSPGAPLAEPDAQRLYAETEGNPLFVVEALRAGWAPGRAAQPARAVRDRGPARAARRPGEGARRGGGDDRPRVPRRRAGRGGRRCDEDVLVRGLDELWRRRILREQGADATGYDFSHDKLREVAALGVSPARRRLLHLRVAAALEQAHAADPGRSAPRSPRTTRRRRGEHAVTWYRRAAEAAQALHATTPPSRSSNGRWTCCATLPPSAGRDAAELELRPRWWRPLASMQGTSPP